ncbi:MAG TPA: MBL fold metallo-hydrolase, partial [Candidatus Polarisedimenticolia bacterium]|nr:MBL fold metallo-hydrolase [Candidatus Polarisedimenticolia bacterium]
GIRLAVLGSGSAGNATCIEGGGARLLLDAGFSCRELGARLAAVGVEPHRLDALVITHEHADHVRGAALFARTHKIPVYCTAGTARAANLDRRAGTTHLPVEAGVPFAIGGLRIEAFEVPHDAAETVGFVFDCEEGRIGYATDLGHSPEAVRRGLSDCDLLVLESNHDVAMLRAGPYPEVIKQRVLGRHGHLDNETAADLACEVAGDRTRRLILAHLSRTNNRPDLALSAARQSFERAGRRAPALHAAEQWASSPWFEV